MVTRRSLLTAITLGAFSTPGAADASTSRRLLNGTDISWLPSYEAHGGKFYNLSGRRVDAFTLLKESGARLVRVRIFVNPAGRNGSLADALALAKRAQKAGLKYCLDFHFSDDWADPGKQAIPSRWKSLSLQELTVELAAYVSGVASAFNAAGLPVHFVQLGNEVTNGFLWPMGRIDSDSAEQWQDFASLYSAAEVALRASLPKAQTVLHLDCGGDAERVRWWLGNAERCGIKADIIGLSYYSQWQGSLSNLSATLRVVAHEYRKRVVVAETAYPYTAKTFGGDIIDVKRSALSGYPLTKTGQKRYLSKLNQMMRELPGNRGFGIWWWEGLAGGPFGLANAALVDAKGRALPALNELAG